MLLAERVSDAISKWGNPCHCFCHTHDILAKQIQCGHCIKVKSTPVKGWEEDQMNQFWKVLVARDDYIVAHIKKSRSILPMAEIAINSLLAKQKKEITEWAINEELPEPDCHQNHRDLVAGYNQALLKLRQFLKDKV